MGVVILALTLFLPAGRWDWDMGWALVALMFAWATGTAVILVRRSPGLIAERVGPRKGAKSWDTAIMGVVGLLTLARCLLSGFDERYGWTTGIGPWLQIAALVIAVLAYGLVLWATAANAYFSQIVRIQEERGHAVAKGGPYRFVRHPAYVGTILFELSVPLMLGSWWAFIPGVFSAVLFVVRTWLEDRTLIAELSGYEEYATQVRYRLVPGVW
jgi:protein-S-isoprenylcysteine O-methyltransferase Ste14